MNSKPLVSVCCLAYNHEPYIAQALEGFVMQKANFSFEVLIHDDASTDGTADIIRTYEKKYPDIIKPIYQTENQYSKEVGRVSQIVFKETQGKYIAMCEGDDYWTDPLKLQKQVDFLEENEDFGLVHTNHDIYYAKKGIFKKNIKNSLNLNDVTTFENLLLYNWISTLTVVMRTDILRSALKSIENYTSGWIVGDYPLWLEISLRSKIKFLNVNTAVYRVLENSVSHSKSFQSRMQFFETIYAIRNFFISNYDCPHELKEDIVLQYLKEKLRIAFFYKDNNSAKESFESIIMMKRVNFSDRLFYFGSFNQITFILILIIKRVFKVK